jgi:hypothetical protein
MSNNGNVPVGNGNHMVSLSGCSFSCGLYSLLDLSQANVPLFGVVTLWAYYTFNAPKQTLQFHENVIQIAQLAKLRKKIINLLFSHFSDNHAFCKAFT